MLETKTQNYKKILSEIAEERGLNDLAKHIQSFNMVERELKEIPTTFNIPEKPIYNITIMPDQSCDGCA